MGALRQAERYVPLEGLDTYQVTPALTGEILRPLLAAEGDVRMHGQQRGAVVSFADTLPLLHPFGRMVCHDLFTTDSASTGPASTGRASTTGRWSTG